MATSSIALGFLIFLFLLPLVSAEYGESHALVQVAGTTSTTTTTVPGLAEEINLCYRIVKIWDYDLCMTSDGKFMLITTASLGFIAIPIAKKIKKRA